MFLKSDKQSESRKYWKIAFWGITLTILQTSIYHLPMNLDFMALKYDGVTASSKLQGWIFSHWIRIGIAIISGVFALKGFQKSTNSHPSHG